MGFIRGIGPMELIIVLVIVMIIFGVGKLPEIGGSLGKAIREFRLTQNEKPNELNESTSDSNDKVEKT